MRKWLPLLAVCLGTLMLLVDVTIVNVALPAMAGDLRASFSSLQWVVDGYALALAALLLGIGSLADRIGHRTSYVAGLVLFALASLVCGLAPTAGALVVARAVQGVGGAAMFATTFALLNSAYTGRDRGTAYGVWGAVAGAASAIGPLAGGPLTQGLSWRWIFFVNLPVSIAAVVLTLLVVDGTHAPARQRFDLAGLVVFTGAAGLLTFGMIEANTSGWADAASWGPSLGGLLLVLVFGVVERRVANPLLDLTLLRHPTFSGVLLAGAVLSFSAFVSFTYTSIWLQSVLGLGPVEAGLVGLPMSAAAFAVSVVVGRMLAQWSPRWVIAAGLLVIGVGDLVGFVLVRGSAGAWALLPGFFVIGVGVGFATPSLSATGMAAVPARRGGMAAGAVNTARQLGSAFGIALLGSVFTTGVRSSLADSGRPDPEALAGVVASGRARESLSAVPDASRGALRTALEAAAVHGVGRLFLVAGVVAVLASFVVLVMIRPRSTAPDTHVTQSLDSSIR
ncbi:MFS transporter [Streptomyces sp. NPDC026672]|uniref:MFS transporter n=1 Tax=unclassified Streptomyces TaxID=2593676 RepID=UPI0033FD7FF4